MKRKLVAATLAFSLVAGNAHGMSACVGPQDELALKTASMQQMLMVAALSCGDVAAYNRFVIAHQVELQQSDAALLTFFVRENAEAGEASYHAFKTKAANVSSLESARDRGAYCAEAGRLFGAAYDAYGASLAWFVSSQWRAAGEVVQASCTGDAGELRATHRYEAPVASSPAEPSLAGGTAAE